MFQLEKWKGNENLYRVDRVFSNADLAKFLWINSCFQQTRAKPGAVLQTASLLIHSLTDSVILFLPQLYGAATPKRLAIAPPVIK